MPDRAVIGPPTPAALTRKPTGGRTATARPETPIGPPHGRGHRAALPSPERAASAPAMPIGPTARDDASGILSWRARIRVTPTGIEGI